MFKRRRATSSPVHSNPPPSASASLAATKAFLKDRTANAELSSAAAAAALRTHPTKPVSVGDTVTKRMVRKGSTSSQGSGSQQGLGLRRHSSSGSMTERSFRAPSPSRNSPVAGHYPDDAPPVPAVPHNVPGVGVVHRRASSLDPPSRGGSPLARGSGRGSSLDRGMGATPGRGQRVMSLSQVPEHAQDDNPRLVNFSRPISPSASPTLPSGPARTGHSGWFTAPVVNPEQAFRGASISRPKTASGVLRYDAQDARQSVQNAADRPVSTRRSQVSHGVEGARLAAGSMGTRPSGSSVTSSTAAMQIRPSQPVNPKSQDAVYDPSTRSFIRKQDAMARFRELHDEEEAPVDHYELQHAVPPNPQSSPQHVSHLPPPTFHRVPERSPSPPRHYAEVEAHQKTERASQGHLQDLIEAVHEDDWAPTPQSESAHPHPTRQKSEDFARADIRPSVDANTSRLLESKVPQTGTEAPRSPTSPKIPPNQDSPYPRVGTPVNQIRTDTGAGRGRGSVSSDRGQSLSPPRNAHFASLSLELPDGIRHQPPPRSVSPAKSALKSSPSVSRRNSSPLSNNGRVLSKFDPGEASDAMSDDGIKKKKKSIRVSFEEAPVIAGTSAYADAETPTSPTGLSQSRWSNNDQDETLDDVMRPRPALPSFGSVRGKNRRNSQEDAPEKVTETVSSSMSTSIGSIAEPIEASSDHALGGILAHDLASKKQSSQQDPLPPEVTSVEGSGYFSDSDSNSNAHDSPTTTDHSKIEEAEHPLPEPKTLTTPVETKLPVPEVPEIAIQPATPNLAEKAEPRFQRPFVPGGWEDDEESEQEETPQIHQPGTVTMPTSIAQPALAPNPPPNEPETSDDNDSIYSDAYEELTDTEDGGFASIDKIVESAIVPSGLMHSKYADSSATNPPLKVSLQKEHPVVAKEDSARASTDAPDASYRSKSQQHASGAGRASDGPLLVLAPTQRPAKQKQEKMAPQKPRGEQLSSVPKSARASQPVQQPAQPRKSALKKTTVATQPVAAPEPHMRKSMRGGPGPQPSAKSETHMRKSMRSSEPLGPPRAATGLAASRHSMPPADSRLSKGTLQKKYIPAVPAVPRTRPHSVGQPVTSKPKAISPTYDSDSDASASSFQRQRPRASRGTGGGFALRRTMRTDAAPTMRNTPTMRPISPPILSSSPPPPAFRSSLRPTSPATQAGAMKSSKFSIRSLSPAGRFRPTIGKSPKAKAPDNKAKPRFNSRFGDSSDEEYVDRPRRFQSRFADSDDEDFELPTGLTPVRGIPKPRGDVDYDSTDLEDEDSDHEPAVAKSAPQSTEKGKAAMANGKATLDGPVSTASSLQQSKHAPDLPTFGTGKKPKAKRGFFGLGKKKTGPPQSVEHTEAQIKPPDPDQAADQAADIPMPPAHRQHSTNSTNRPLTPIGENKSLESSPVPRSPKLQRRLTPQWGRSTSDSWPLPEARSVDQEARPVTSDGVVNEGTTRVTSIKTSIGPKSEKNVIVGRTGKKKKFQGLRRVFGLND